MKKLYAVLWILGLVALSSVYTNEARAEYRLEHDACPFSFVTPGAPALIPVWPREERYYAPFTKDAPLVERDDNIRALKVAYNEAYFDNNDSLSMTAYCMEFDEEMIGESLSPDEMFVFLKNAIGQVDPQKLKEALSNAKIDLVEQKNGIKWLKVHALVEERKASGYQELTSYTRDIFAFKNRLLVLFINYSAENKKYQSYVRDLLSSMILSE